MAKLQMGIKDSDNLIITARDKLGRVASNIEMHCNTADLPSINSNVNVKNPLGGAEDFLSMATPPPLSMIPGVPARIPTQIPLQDYAPFLATAAASLGATLISSKLKES